MLAAASSPFTDFPASERGAAVDPGTIVPEKLRTLWAKTFPFPASTSASRRDHFAIRNLHRAQIRRIKALFINKIYMLLGIFYGHLAWKQMPNWKSVSH